MGKRRIFSEEGVKKYCPKCKEEKPVSEFGPSKNSPDGLRWNCYDCRKIESREYYQKHKESRKKTLRNYYDNNKEQTLAYSKLWYKENKERLKKHRTKRRFGPAPYNTYYNQLTVEEEPICGENGELVVKCSKCGEYYIPILTKVIQRITSLKGQQTGESRLYCSDKCRNECSIYHAKSFPKGLRSVSVASRCNQQLNKKQLLDLQLDEFGYNFCEKCGKEKLRKELIIHHNSQVSKYPEEADNMAHQILVCKGCHTHEKC